MGELIIIEDASIAQTQEHKVWNVLKQFARSSGNFGMGYSVRGQSGGRKMHKGRQSSVRQIDRLMREHIHRYLLREQRPKSSAYFLQRGSGTLWATAGWSPLRREQFFAFEKRKIHSTFLFTFLLIIKPVQLKKEKEPVHSFQITVFDIAFIIPSVSFENSQFQNKAFYAEVKTIYFS